MKKLVLILVVVMMVAIAGCISKENPIVDNQNENSTENVIQKNMEKFLHDGDTYSAELFVEMANTYKGILNGKSQQAYVFDLRSKEEYNNGHIVGSINLEFNPDRTEELVNKIPSDWSVYIIGDENKAKALADNIRKHDNLLFVYTITGGYEALLEVEGFVEYVSTVPGEFIDFQRND